MKIVLRRSSSCGLSEYCASQIVTLDFSVTQQVLTPIRNIVTSRIENEGIALTGKQRNFNSLYFNREKISNELSVYI